jgi:phosphohistidine phosphatase SixA
VPQNVVREAHRVTRPGEGTPARTVTLRLIRHAKAGSRPDWAQPDDLRPLTGAGHRQAEDLARRLADADIERVLSSRYARCVQTVEPLARALGLEVEHHPALAEEADLDETFALLAELAPTPSALCTHGNVVDGVIDRLRRRGVKLVGRDGGGRKGSVWAIEVRPDGRFIRAVHTPPPG